MGVLLLGVGWAVSSEPRLTLVSANATSVTFPSSLDGWMDHATKDWDESSRDPERNFR